MTNVQFPTLKAHWESGHFAFAGHRDLGIWIYFFGI
jgi:hypothetical protein